MNLSKVGLKNKFSHRQAEWWSSPMEIDRVEKGNWGGQFGGWESGAWSFGRGRGRDGKGRGKKGKRNDKGIKAKGSQCTTKAKDSRKESFSPISVLFAVALDIEAIVHINRSPWKSTKCRLPILIKVNNNNNKYHFRAKVPNIQQTQSTKNLLEPQLQQLHPRVLDLLLCEQDLQFDEFFILDHHHLPHHLQVPRCDW